MNGGTVCQFNAGCLNECFIKRNGDNHIFCQVHREVDLQYKRKYNQAHRFPKVTRKLSEATPTESAPDLPGRPFKRRRVFREEATALSGKSVFVELVHLLHVA
jgi:hypothetical protein